MKKFFGWLGIQDAFEKGLIAKILIILCLLFISFGLILLFARLFQALHPAYESAHWSDLLLESMILLFGLTSLWLIRTDRIRAASWVVLAGLLIAVTLNVYFIANASNDIAGALGLQLFAILAILLLGRRDRWIAIILVIGVFIGLNILSTTGKLVPVSNQDPFGILIFNVFVWISVSSIIAVVVFAASSAMRREPQLLQELVNGSQQNGGNNERGLQFRSTHDALTNLYNRFFFEVELARMENSRLYPISIIMLEVPNLKELNTKFGISTGDQVLINVARMFSKVFRHEDIISRYGGDEFAILLPGADASIAKRAIERITEQVNKYNQKHKDQAITISTGTSTASQGESLKNHLKQADKLMRQNENVIDDK